MTGILPELLLGAAIVLLLSLGVGLVRVARGPTPADRMMAAQLAGTTGVGILLLLDASGHGSGALDVALVLALLAAVTAVGFAKAASPGGNGDPEVDDGAEGPYPPSSRRSR